MPGLYRVPLVEGCKSVKQRLRKTNLNVLIKVKVEIEKQWNADFLKVVKYPQWVSNIVVVPKKEDKIKVWTLGTKNGLALKIIFLYHTWMYWSIHIFLYGWIFGLQLYENGARGLEEDNICNTMGNPLLRGHAIWVEECRGHLPKGHGDYIS